MSLISGIHHVSMKCVTEEEYQAVVAFYAGTLEMPIVRRWDNGLMLDTGSGIVEIFLDGEQKLEKGVIRHFAFAVQDVDACVKAVREAGFEVFVGPMDISIPSNPPFPARIAFCNGPLGEEIEFFQET